MVAWYQLKPGTPILRASRPMGDLDLSGRIQGTVLHLHGPPLTASAAKEDDGGIPVSRSRAHGSLVPEGADPRMYASPSSRLGHDLGRPRARGVPLLD